MAVRRLRSATAVSIANAAAAVRRVATIVGGDADAAMVVDRRLASIWFAVTFDPIGWRPPPMWDSIAGVYPCGDSFVRLHTNAPHHKAAALRLCQWPLRRKNSEIY